MPSPEIRMSRFEAYHKYGDKRAEWRKEDRKGALEDLLQDKTTKRLQVCLIRELSNELLQTRNLLDVGCGTGLLLEYLIAKGHTSCQGIEPMPDQFEACHKVGLPVRHMSVYDLGIERKHYSGIVMMGVIEHLQWPERALSIVGRVCDTLWITTPSISQQPSRKGAVPVLSSEYHLREWSADCLQDFVQGCIGSLGFDIQYSKVIQHPSKHNKRKTIIQRWNRRA